VLVREGAGSLTVSETVARNYFFIFSLLSNAMERKTFFRQYIPLKSSKFGIKSYELCESSSGYLWSFIIYTGKDTVFQTAFISGDTNKTAAILLSLVEPLLKKGRTLWMDNFCNSPALAQRV